MQITYAWVSVAEHRWLSRKRWTPMLGKLGGGGLTPRWRGAKAILAFNARAESLTERPLFRGLVAQSRCIVPASGWYEWTAVPGQKTKQPWFITDPFVDLNPGSPHNANIAALADAGITRGCDPGVAYCPNGTVTREEMASFLARAAGLGENPPVANARTAQTVPDRSVTVAKLSPDGAISGQVLTATGDGVAWQTVANGAGPMGPTGATCAPGPPGPPAGAQVAVRSTDGQIPAFSTAFLVAACAEGEGAIVGGYEGASAVTVTTSRPVSPSPLTTPQPGWTVTFKNDTPNPAGVSVFAVCAPAVL